MRHFFWADTHFNHAGIIKHCKRGYATVEEMNDDLLTRWNNTVTDRDVIWILGDFMFKAAGQSKHDLAMMFHQLQGDKRLIVGNHDERNGAVLDLPWTRVEKLFTFKWEGRRAELCHYPLETWKMKNYGALMLHGHCHGTLEREVPRRFDVGCDVEPYPIDWEELWERVG